MREEERAFTQIKVAKAIQHSGKWGRRYFHITMLKTKEWKKTKIHCKASRGGNSTQKKGLSCLEMTTAENGVLP